MTFSLWWPTAYVSPSIWTGNNETFTTADLLIRKRETFEPFTNYSVNICTDITDDLIQRWSS